MPSAVEALLDPQLLRADGWLEENELLARAARAWLGSTAAEVIATLKADPSLPFGTGMRAMLAHDSQPLPSSSCACPKDAFLRMS